LKRNLCPVQERRLSRGTLRIFDLTEFPLPAESMPTSDIRKPFIYGCSAAPRAAAMDGAQVNHDQGSLKPCADQVCRARPM